MSSTNADATVSIRSAGRTGSTTPSRAGTSSYVVPGFAWRSSRSTAPTSAAAASRDTPGASRPIIDPRAEGVQLTGIQNCICSSAKAKPRGMMPITVYTFGSGFDERAFASVRL